MSASARVRVFLSRPLFTLPGEDAHVPPQAVILLGALVESPSGGMLIDADGYLDEKGRKLAGVPRRLMIGGGKIDHVVYE